MTELKAESLEHLPSSVHSTHAYFPYGVSASAFNYVLWDMRMDQTSFDSLNSFLRTPANTDNMLFFRINYFDRQDYNDTRKTAATTLVTIAFSCHLGLHDGMKNLHSLVRKTLEGHRINLCRSLFVCFLFGWVFFPSLCC